MNNNTQIKEKREHLRLLIRRKDCLEAIAEVKEEIKLLQLTPLVSLDQLNVGTKLKIIGRTSKNNYNSISVKELIRKNGDIEVLINKSKNYYFNLSCYLKGESWANKVFILNGTDRRLKGFNV